MDDQLDAVSRSFLADPLRNDLDAENRRARLSKVFSWFGEDFDVAPYHGVRGFVRAFAPSADWLAEEFAISYLDYDWSLNEQREGR